MTDDRATRVFQRNPAILYEAGDGRGMLIDPRGTELIELNPVGTAVWEALDGRRPIRAIADEVADRFKGPEGDAVASDVAAFLAELEALGLVEIAPGTDGVDARPGT